MTQNVASVLGICAAWLVSAILAGLLVGLLEQPAAGRKAFWLVLALGAPLALLQVLERRWVPLV
jgi:flagellar biosynthesis protein FliQ